jgi:hypothetical protein
VSTEILPLLLELNTAGRSQGLTLRGQASEARVQEILQGTAGTAFTAETELKAVFKFDGPFSTLTNRRFIRLADIRKGPRTICPMAFLDGDFSKGHPRLRIQLIIVSLTPQGNEKPQCLIMRFETPEGSDPAGQGEHDYYHSQLCTELRVDSSTKTFRIPNCMAWNAVSCPAWPVDASTPFQLLACLVFSLYGKVEGMLTLRRAYRSGLDELMDRMHFAFPPMSAPALGRKAKKTNRKSSSRR